jgi:hypothetical protein
VKCYEIDAGCRQYWVAARNRAEALAAVRARMVGPDRIPEAYADALLEEGAGEVTALYPEQVERLVFQGERPDSRPGESMARVFERQRAAGAPAVLDASEY